MKKESVRTEEQRKEHREYMRIWIKKHKEYKIALRDNQRFGGKRDAALKRDNYICQKCGMTNENHKKKWGRTITVHHIDGTGRNSTNQNNSIDNLITLCLSCHGTTDIENYWRNRKAQ